MVTEVPVTPPPPPELKVVRLSNGWEIREMQNDHIVRSSLYTDWHRVERALQVYDLRSRYFHSTNR
jgi:hypothetical protein